MLIFNSLWEDNWAHVCHLVGIVTKKRGQLATLLIGNANVCLGLFRDSLDVSSSSSSSSSSQQCSSQQPAAATAASSQQQQPAAAAAASSPIIFDCVLHL